jgi:hypothetical protein
VPVILATQEIEIRTISVQSQPGQIMRSCLEKKKSNKKSAGGVVQVIVPEFNLQYHKKKIIEISNNLMMQPRS